MHRLLPLVLLMTALPAAAQLQVTRLVGDGMVMQRDAPVPVWGTAAPGADVRVTFDGGAFDAVAGADGAWSVVLPARPAGGPYTLSVASGGERVDAADVLVGDVWIASGQSNMEWTVKNAADAAAEIAGADDASIRHFKVPQSWSSAPEATLAGGAWAAAAPETVGDFSAVGYFFARAVRRHVDVPVAILNTSWGGSRIEPWMHADALGLGPDAQREIEERERRRAETVRAGLRARIGELPEVDGGMVDGVAVWADPAYDDAGWTRIAVPTLWEGAGYDGLDGVAWYRTSFDLTAGEAAEGVRLSLGPIDDADVTWVNGREVGRTDGYNLPRVYDVPAEALAAGRNVVAVRVTDTGGGGGLYASEADLYVKAGHIERPLAGEWAFRVGVAAIDGGGGQKNQMPTLLYNKMIHPLLPYPVAGFLWYQGESNAGSSEDAAAYEELFQTMIRDWRARWGRGDLPFLWVQLANFMAPADEPRESTWAELRAAQTAALALPNTAEAVIIDIGEADDIHPRNKQDVGERLARAARHVAYGEALVHSGPVYAAHRTSGGRVMVAFEHVGGGLQAHGTADGAVRGFDVAGADGRWVRARARVEGDRVIVWNDDVPRPVAVRYAWADNPDRANLYNAEGLPATPFRSDR